MPHDTLALDRASVSARTKDEAGHLHVADVAISKAGVNVYLGSEIPRWKDLRLDPQRRYALLRDPDEMAKAVDTFNGKPVLNEHKPQMAADHDHDLTVGSIHGAYFDAPYLRVRDFSVWDGESIAAIENDTQKQLSAAYFFEPDMTPGIYQGARYDGVMRSLRGNHVALVTKGRAGPDCVVGDQALPQQRTNIMAKSNAPKSRRALLALGATSAYLTPKLAQDAALDLTPIFANVSAKNWKASKPKIAAALTKATEGKLAQDATIEDVIEMLDQLDAIADDMPDAPTAAVVAPVEDEMEGATERLKAALKAKGMTDEEIEALCKGERPATDEPTVPPKTPVEKDDKVTKPAMDAALARVRSETEAAVVARMKAVREAENAVRDIIGEIPMAQDSAADVYRLAMDHVGIKHDGVDPSAFPVLIEMHKQNMAAASTPKTPRLAMDAAANKKFAERFPHANRL